MNLLDANILIYARSKSFPQHDRARKWLEGVLNGRSRVALPWPSLLAFMRILSNPRVVQKPETPQALWEQVEEWLALPCVWVPVPSERHAACLQSLLPAVSGSNLVPDAHLAALAMEYGLTVCSTDGDFARFEGIRWVNPLA